MKSAYQVKAIQPLRHRQIAWTSRYVNGTAASLKELVCTGGKLTGMVTIR